VLKKKHSAKSSLPSVKNKTLGKETLCRVSKIKHSSKGFFAECFLLQRVFCVALGKELLCRVPEKKHSGKHLALGKELNSGSDSGFGFRVTGFLPSLKKRPYLDH
jgi:hypothetical protein